MASNHLNEGAIIDERYVVRTEIGIGNMATVYLAEDAIAQRSVAIKVMSERLVGRPDRERRFFNEDRFQALLANHPNVVRTYGHGRVSGPDSAPYLAMEHVAGPSLGLLITVKKCLEPEHVVHLGLGIANGLRAIHRAGIVHRDVKPDNILVAIAQSRETADEVAKIADFGLAIQLTDAQGAQVSRMTHHLAIPGSSGYIAPEATSFAVPSPSMDVFGLGMVLLEALTGINPYAETSREAYLEEIARPEWAIPSAALAEVACAPLRALVAECTQRDPNARPTIDEVIGRLETIRASLRMPVGGTSHAKVEVVSSGGGTRRGWLAGAVGLLLLLGGVVGWASWPKATERGPSTSVRDEHDAAAVLPVAAPAPTEVAHGETGADSQATVGDATSGGEMASTTGGETTGAPANAKPPRPGHSGKPRRSPRAGHHPVPTVDVEQEDDSKEQPRATEQRCAPIVLSVSELMREGVWSRVPYTLKANRSCFDAAEYRRILVEALARLGRTDECIEAARGSNDPKVLRWADQCKDTQP